MLSFSFASGQETCGLQEVPDSVYAAYANSLANHHSALKRQGGGVKNNQVFKIPLHLYIAQYPDGRLPFDSSRASIEALFITSLQFVNESMASHGVEFYIVESDVLPFPINLFDQTEPMETNVYVSTNYPNDYDVNSFRVYLTEVSYAEGEYPYGVVIGGGNTNARWLMHEIGHFFGLLHTQQQAWRNNRIWLYPDNTPTSAFDFNTLTHTTYNQQYCGDGSDTGLCYGDFITSTPTDILDKFCPDLDRTKFNCQQPCTVNSSNQDTAYNFDFFNVMSYWRLSSTRLLPEQKQRIYDVIAYDSLGSRPFGGDMGHLTDADVPIVTFVPPNYAYLRQTGMIDLARYYPNTSSELAPFFQGKVRTRYFGPRTIVLHHRPYLGDGIFKMNRFIPINEPNTSVRFRFDSLSHECEPLPIYESGNYLDVGDVIAIQQHILGQHEITDPYQKIAADVNNSGHIRTSDIVMIIRRILLDEPFTVPDYRFVPKYALSEYFSFANNFNTDPFSASWTYNGNTYSYVGSPSTESYLGKEETTGGMPNLQSFALSLTDTNALKPVAVSFNAVRSGDVNMEEDIIGDNICGTGTEDQLLGNGAILKKGQKNVVKMSFSHVKGFMGMVGVLSIANGNSAFISEIYANDISSVGPLAATGVTEEVKSNESINSFAGTVLGGTKELKFLILPPSGPQKASYIEFTVEGLKKDQALSEILSLDCDGSQVFSKTEKSNGNKIFSNLHKVQYLEILSTVVTSSMSNKSVNASEIVLFPNPVSNTLFVELPKRYQDGNLIISIYDVNGKRIDVVSFLGGGLERFSLPVSKLASGVYFISIKHGSGGENVRFVKQ